MRTARLSLLFNSFRVIFERMSEPHRKTHPSLREARREQSLLRLVAGDGVVPLHHAAGGADGGVTTVCGAGSLADLLATAGPLPEAVARGTGARITATLARLHAAGVVHGDVKPANVVFAPDGDLWLVDFDAAGMAGTERRRATPGRLPRPDDPLLRTADDVIALVVMVVECATGAVLDPSIAWTGHDLRRLGCSAELAADLAEVLRDPPAADRMGALLHRRDVRLPTPPGAATARGSDPTPTITLPTVAIAGLTPAGESAPSTSSAPSGARRGAATAHH